MTWNDVLTVVNSADTLLGLAFLLYLGWRLWARLRRPRFRIRESLMRNMVDSEHGEGH